MQLDSKFAAIRLGKMLTVVRSCILTNPSGSDYALPSSGLVAMIVWALRLLDAMQNGDGAADFEENETQEGSGKTGKVVPVVMLDCVISLQRAMSRHRQ